MRRIDGGSAATYAAFEGALERPDPHIQFGGWSGLCAEVDLPDVLGTATDGYVGTIHGHIGGNVLRLGGEGDEDNNPLTGPIFQRCNVGRPARDLAEFRSMITQGSGSTSMQAWQPPPASAAAAPTSRRTRVRGRHRSGSDLHGSVSRSAMRRHRLRHHDSERDTGAYSAT